MEQGLENCKVKVVLPNTLGYERVAMACSASFARIYGLPAERIEDLKTIVAEAATNAMQHGNGGRPEAQVTVKLKVIADLLRITVKDEGDGFNGVYKDPDIDRIIAEKDDPVGFGLFLMRQLADGLDFKRLHGGGHMVEMLINLKSQAHCGDP